MTIHRLILFILHESIWVMKMNAIDNQLSWYVKLCTKSNHVTQIIVKIIANMLSIYMLVMPSSLTIIKNIHIVYTYW